MSTLAISVLASLAALSVLSKLIVAPAAFTKHRDLVLETLSLVPGSYITTDHAKTIWVHEQAFLSWSKV